MLFSGLILPALLAGSIAAHPGIRSEAGLDFCGTPAPTEEQIQASKFLLERERLQVRSASERTLKVDTVFHVVAASESQEDGYVTQNQIDDQLAVINDRFAPHGISFNLINVTRTIDSGWATTAAKDWGYSFKSALRQGNYSTLNIYSVKSAHPEEAYYGYCHYPVPHHQLNRERFISDGPVIRAGTVPGGTANGRNSGLILVHEIGHWFNLIHPFEGGCHGGDEVDDTPPQANWTSKVYFDSCNANQDTCPGDGTDPVHNYMNYSADKCWTEFTAGQADRIYSSWEKYRKGSSSPPGL